MKDRIKALCKKKGVSMNTAEKEIGLAKGYISKLDKSNPNMTTLQKMADYFGVSVEYLITGKENESNDSELTARDERDIAKSLDHIMSEIKSGADSPLYYNGVEIDDASLNLLQNAIEFALRETKKENKVKYNPNKNKE